LEYALRGQSKQFLRSHAAIGSKIDHGAVSLPRPGDLLIFGICQVVGSAQDRKELFYRWYLDGLSVAGTVRYGDLFEGIAVYDVAILHRKDDGVK